MHHPIHNILTPIDRFSGNDLRFIISTTHGAMPDVIQALEEMPTRELREVAREPMLMIAFIRAYQMSPEAEELVTHRLTVDGHSLMIGLCQAELREVFFTVCLDLASCVVLASDWRSIYRAIAPIAYGPALARTQEERLGELFHKVFNLVVRTEADLLARCKGTPTDSIFDDAPGAIEVLRSHPSTELIARLVALFDEDQKAGMSAILFTGAFALSGWPTWRTMSAAVNADRPRARRTLILLQGITPQPSKAMAALETLIRMPKEERW